MKIACNSGYVQTVTLNSPSPGKPHCVFICLFQPQMWLLSLWQHNVITSLRITACCCDEAKTSETVLHFCIFSPTPIMILNLTKSSESQWKDVSNDILSIQKYCQLFRQASNTLLLNNTPFKLMGRKLPKTSQTPLSLTACWPPSNTPMPGTTTLATPNDSPISSCTSAQLCNKVPTGYNGMPQIHLQNCPFPSTITTHI